MDGKNLGLKFAILFIVAALCVWLVASKGLKQGIDLQGGHSLIYEIVTNEAKIDELKERRDKVVAMRDVAPSPDKKAELVKSIERIDAEIEDLESSDTGDLAARMIAVLKRRVDPNGFRNLQWTPQGEGRIEIRMPAATGESKVAREAYRRELKKLKSRNITQSQIGRVERAKPGAARASEIATLAKGSENLVRLLGELGAGYDAVQAIDRRKDEASYQNAVAAWEVKLREVKKHNVSLDRLQAVLANDISAAEEKIMGSASKELKKRKDAFAQSLAFLKKDYPDRKDEIEAVLASYRSWNKVRQHLDDPADLKRLIAKAGVLEFRVAPQRAGSSGDMSLTQAQWMEYRDDLEKNGPSAAAKRSAPYQWFVLHDDDSVGGGLLTDEYAGKMYQLLCNQPENTMLQSGVQRGWSLKSSRVTSDRYGTPAVGFAFDERGAKRFGRLTMAHKGHAMAILLDDEVYSCPNIQETITSEGIITGKFTMAEVTDLVRTLEAGSLPARLNPKPVAESTFGPGIGKNNRDRAKTAAIAAMIAVAAFMLFYYMLPGLIANIALAMNILLVLGAMSMMNVVFTLPGIAGLILTIGIAVDANVLIFERLREEQAKAQSVRMAIKNAYERAFSAIFDANITTVIICLILAWIGTEEVRGFAITLGMGVAFSMFTSLVVTRWMFQALGQAGMMKKPVFMMHIIGVPKINWMGKRKIFWAISTIMIVVGLVSLVKQGKDLLGIEFSSGTKAVVRLTDDALIDGVLPTDASVRTSFQAAAEKLGYEILRSTALVEMVINPDQAEEFMARYDSVDDPDGKISKQEWSDKKMNAEFFALMDANSDGSLDAEELKELPATSYQIATTENDIDVLKKTSEEAFGVSLQRRRKCEFDLVRDRSMDELGVHLLSSGYAPVKRMDESRYRETLQDFDGGAVMVVENVKPALTIDELRTRIGEMRFQPDFESLMLHESHIEGLVAADKDRYSSFAVFVRPSDERKLSPAAWNGFAEQEMKLLSAALERESAMVARNFDPQLAADNVAMAIMAVVASWLAIVIYLWFRFGSARWGLAAVLCLVHDVIIVVGLVALAGLVHNSFIGRMLGLTAFKIDVPMIAAILTVIGYSVNDTIVVFDRIRENRGRLTSVSAQVINTSVNQTLSRTLLTSGTTFIVVLIMYIWGGPAIHAFNYALLVGIIFGTYSSVAIASPLLMGFKQALVAKVTAEPASQK